MGQDDQDRQGADPVEVTGNDPYDALKAHDIRTERRIFWRELTIILLSALLVAAYLVALSIRLGSLPMPSWLA